jgi:aminotransferase
MGAGSRFFRGTERGFIHFHFVKKEETLRAAGGKLVAGLKCG